jgi:hypothetical protein
MPTRRDVLVSSLATASLPLVLGRVTAKQHPLPLLSAATKATGLGAIRAVTLTAPDLHVAQVAWTQYMGYRLVAEGHVSKAAAAAWDAPAVADSPYIVLGPKSGEHTFLRFIQQPNTDTGSDAGTFGWSATEITVQNTDALYERLKSSPFKVTGPPATIPTYSYLRAMQAIGPSGEHLNLTWITEPRPDLAVAKSFVGRCFITVLTAPDLSEALHFYENTFGNLASPIRQLPSLTLAVVTLAEGAKIEVDQSAPAAHSRPRPAGALPPGIAVVTFDCSRFDSLTDRFIRPPSNDGLEPFRGKSVASLRGPANELIELLQT